MIAILRKKPAFLFCSAALLVSSIGTGLTSVVVYAELERRGASPFYFALAFVLGLLPGVITSGLASRLGGRWPLFRCIFWTQVAGAILLAVPAWGLARGNLKLLVLAEGLGSAISGLLAPLYQQFVKQSFAEGELAVLSRYDTLVFTSNFLLAQVAGTFLYGLFGRQLYLFVDWLSYFAALALLARASAFSEVALGVGESRRFRWSGLSLRQKRVFLFIPLLSLGCGPLMALLPAVGARFAGYPVSICLLYLLARGLGQLAGPWIAGRWDLDRLLSDTRLLIFCLAGYWALYAFVFNTSAIGWASVAIVLAHCLSNLAWTAGSYGLTKNFSVEEIGPASAAHYQLSILSVSVAALLAGACGHFVSFNSVLILSFLGVVTWGLHLQVTSEPAPKLLGGHCHVV